MYKLLRIRYEGVGHREARFDPLVLDFRGEVDEPPQDTAVWLRNGGGKTSLLALFFSLLQPRRTDFLGGGRSLRRSSRLKRLEDYVAPRDVGHVVAEWGLASPNGQQTLDGARYLRRLVTGQVLAWRRSGGQEEIEPHYYAFEPRPDQLELDDLPFRRDERHRTPAGEFVSFLGRAAQASPGLSVVSTDNKREWVNYLEATGLDPEIIRYQLSMNEHEGGAEEFLDFRDGDSFVAFLLRLVADPARAEQVQQNIGKTAKLVAERPNLQLELTFAEGVLEQLPGLSESNERVRAAEASRRAVISESRDLLARLAVATTGAERVQAEELARRSTLDESLGDSLSERDTLREWVSIAEREVARLRLVEAERARDSARGEVDRLSGEAGAWVLVEEVRRERESAARVSELRAALERVLADAAEQRRAFELAAARYRLRLRRQVDALASREAASERERREAGDRADAAEARRGDAAARLAGLGAERRSLDVQLRAARQRLDALARAGALRPDESVAAALGRIEREADEIDGRLREVEAARLDLEARRRADLDERRAIEARLAEIASLLGRSRDERQQLASRIGRFLALPEIDEWTEGNEVRIVEVAAPLQTHLAAQAADADRELLRLEVESRAARRAAHALRTTGLLPPSDDVERACELLAAAGVDAASGWLYLEQNCPLDRRESAVRDAPDLAGGVIVPSGDLGRAIPVLAGKLVPSQPLTIAEVGAWTGGLAADGVAARHVLAPSAAHHDPAVATEELGRYEELIREAETRRDRLEGRRRRLREASAALADLLGAIPSGGLEGLDHQIAELEATRAATTAAVTALGERVAAAEAELTGLGAERQRLATRQFTLGGWRARLDDARPLDEQLPRLVERLDALGDEERAADAEREAARADVQRERRSAEVARSRLIRESSDRAVVQAELERVPVGVAAIDDAVVDDPAASNQRLESEYRVSRDLYERQTSGSETALQLRVAEEALGATRARLAGEPASRTLRASELLDGPDGVTLAASLAGARRSTELADEARQMLGACEQEFGEARKAYRGAPGARTAELPEDYRSGSHAEAVANYDRVLRLHSELRTRCDDLKERRDAAAGLAERAGDRARNLGILAENLRAALHGDAPEQGTTLATDEIDGADAALEIDVEVARVEVPEAVRSHGAATRALDEATTELRRRARALDLFVRQDSFAPITGPLRDVFRLDHEGRLAAAADEVREEFAKRLVWLRKDLDDLQAHRARVAQELLVLVKEAFALLDRAESFRLPDGLGDWSRHPYLRIGFQRPEPDLLGGRLDTFVEDLMRGGFDRLPEAVALLIAAVRAAIGNQRFEVHVLKPNEGLPRTRSSVSEIASWSGGQKLTTALLLYCVLVHLRGLSRRGQRNLQVSTLLLDNPIGTANHVDLVDLQLKVARALGVQLVVTTGLADYDALAAYPNVIRLRNLRDRHSGRGYVQLDGSLAGSDVLARSGDGRVTAARVYRLPGKELSD